ncbi:MAG: GIN domain-containing protein, partial [Spirochaetota bacterium]
MDANRRTRTLSTIGIIIILGGLAYAGYRTFDRLESRVGGWFNPGESSTRSVSSTGGKATVDVALSEEFRGFSRISTAGGWKIIITSGEYAVSVSAHERDAGDVEVSRRGDTLHLSLASGLRATTSSPEARISVPDLSGIDVDGGAEVRLTGVDSPGLEVRVKGAASVTGIDARIEE